ncbi:MAG: excinuclease ABC subunit UvrC [Gammaproteobacteria bacterium]
MSQEDVRGETAGDGGGERLFDARPVLRRLPHRPGVYRMMGEDAQVLYVGKARDLKKRVTSYFRAGVPGGKTGALVRQVRGIEVTVTRSEGEALILENELIKRHRPRFNILLRDDKSYPYIRLHSEHPYPRLSFYRGSRRAPGRLFGPYPSAGAVRTTLSELQKLFHIRSCEDTYFANRSRPCLQYQIDRCSAPCVGYISDEEYAQDVDLAVRFLEGRGREVVAELGRKMEAASERLAFEEAARYRDRIARLSRVQEAGIAGAAGQQEADVLGVVGKAGHFCVAALFIRGGRNVGSRSWFPRAGAGSTEQEVLGAFVAQHYLDGTVPREILTPMALEDEDLLSEALGARAGRRVALRHRVRGDRARWLQMAADNAIQALDLELAGRAGYGAQLEAVGESLGLDEAPARLECFDVSHTGGESAVASCVVFGPEGAQKSDYRRFNIEGVEPGDDYQAMEQALSRRYQRLKRGEGVLPDILFVDGGRGQLARATGVLQELQVEGVQVVAVAKGPSRKPGAEQLFLADRKRPLILPRDSAALHLIQQIRDEAHRFAIAGHRHRRGKARRSSPLEDIPGLGPKRRRALLNEFGGFREVAAAGIEDLARVPGISRGLAERIYETLHPAD